MNNIEALLRKEGLWTGKTSGQDYVIKCFSGRHEDSTSSLRVHSHTGLFKCFACEYSSKETGKSIFGFFGLIDPPDMTKGGKLKKKIADIRSKNDDITLPTVRFPVTKPYRKIPIELLKRYDAYKVDERIWFVIRDIFGRIKYMTGRYTGDKDGVSKYYILPEKATKILFPAKPVVNKGMLIIVEGIMDVLRLNSYGYENVIAANGVGIASAKTLRQYSPLGLKHIVTMYDGDMGGKNAGIRLEKELKGSEFTCDIISLEEGEDPDSLTKEKVAAYLAEVI